MKKAIATALALLLTSCGYVLVDQKLVDRVTSLESQVQELRGEAGMSPVEEPEEYDVSCALDLPCSFVSDTGPGVITITNLTGHCKRFENGTIPFTTANHEPLTTKPLIIEPSSTEPYTTIPDDFFIPKSTTNRKNTQQDIYYGVAPQVESDDPIAVSEESSYYWVEESSKQRDVYVDVRPTKPRIAYRYETTIMIEGYVSEDFLASGKEKLSIVVLGDRIFIFNFSISVNPDGTFLGTQTIPYSVKRINENSIYITAE